MSIHALRGPRPSTPPSPRIAVPYAIGKRATVSTIPALNQTASGQRSRPPHELAALPLNDHSGSDASASGICRNGGGQPQLALADADRHVTHHLPNLSSGRSKESASASRPTANRLAALSDRSRTAGRRTQGSGPPNPRDRWAELSRARRQWRPSRRRRIDPAVPHPVQLSSGWSCQGAYSPLRAVSRRVVARRSECPSMIEGEALDHVWESVPLGGVQNSLSR
jgi:hypothetical protein